MVSFTTALLALGAASSVVAGPHGHKVHQKQERNVAATVATTTATTTSSTTSTSTAIPTGKRGLAYNNANLTNLFLPSREVTWAYNWGSWTSAISSKLNYVPLLWGMSSDFTENWEGAVNYWLTQNTTHLMSFNEPDYEYQSNLTPSAAAAGYKQYMMPYAGKAKLGSPAVTNGAGTMGLAWLAEFFAACSGCQIDFVPIHWYSLSTEGATLQSQLQAASTLAPGKPIWLTEFGTTDGNDTAFLQQMLPWLDAQSYVERYAYFMAAEGMLVNANGTGLSPYGSVFRANGGKKLALAQAAASKAAAI